MARFDGPAIGQFRRLYLPLTREKSAIDAEHPFSFDNISHFKLRYQRITEVMKD